MNPGELQSIDGYMNLALEKCEEYVDGVKKRSYGDAFVRGNNGRAYFHAESSFTHNIEHSHVHLRRLIGKPQTDNCRTKKAFGGSLEHLKRRQDTTKSYAFKGSFSKPRADDEE